MLAKFDTSDTLGVEKSSGNIFAWLLGLAGAGLLVYKFWWLPKQAKEKAAKTK